MYSSDANPDVEQDPPSDEEEDSEIEMEVSDTSNVEGWFDFKVTFITVLTNLRRIKRFESPLTKLPLSGFGHLVIRWIISCFVFHKQALH